MPTALSGKETQPITTYPSIFFSFSIKGKRLAFSRTQKCRGNRNCEPFFKIILND